jgi:hypothetical protein
MEGAMSNRQEWGEGGLGAEYARAPTGEELQRVQAGIDQTMKALVSVDRFRPQGPVSIITEPVKPPAPAAAKEIPLGPRPAYETAVIDALAARFAGGPNDPVK